MDDIIKPQPDDDKEHKKEVQDASSEQTGDEAPTIIANLSEPKKSKRKLLLILLALALVLGGAFAYRTFVMNKDDAQSRQTDNSPNQSDSFVPKQFVQSGREVYFLDNNAELQKLTELEEGEEVLEVVIKEGTPEIRFIKVDMLGEIGPSITSYGTIVGDERKTLVNFPQNVAYYYGRINISPDGSQVFAEISNVDGFAKEFAVFSIADGSKKTVYTPADIRSGLYIPLFWRSDHEVVVQHQSCRNCGGPSTPTLSVISVNTGEIEPLYSDHSDEMQYAGAFPINNGKNVVVHGGDGSNIFDTGMIEDPKPFFIYQVDSQLGEAELIGSAKYPYVKYVGISNDSEQAYISAQNYTDDSTLEDYRLATPKIVALTGPEETREISIDSSRIHEKSYIEQVIEYEGGLLIVVFEQADLGEDDLGYKYTLLKLPTSGENNSITELITRNAKDNFGPESGPRVIVAK